MPNRTGRRLRGRRVWGAIAMTAIGLLIPSVDGALQARSAPQDLAWREAYQSSPAVTEFTTEERFNAFISRVKVPPEMVETIRPKHVTGTMRYRIAVPAKASQLRIRLSNEAGSEPLELTSISVGRASDHFDALPGAIKPVTFSGQRHITIAPGAPALSDPVQVDVVPGSDLLVSVTGPRKFILFPGGGNPVAVASGDQTAADHMSNQIETSGRPIVTGVSVLAPRSTKVVVTLGDSITDGNKPQIGALHSWPDQLARRLIDRAEPATLVSNAGIAGNRLLQPGIASDMGIAGLARLDRDVFRVEGLSHVIVALGTNDIGMSGKTLFGDNPVVTFEGLVFGYRQIISRAHARGVKVAIATILPFGGSVTHSSPEKEALRQQINEWIRHSGDADGVIDFDAALRDPADPARLKAAYDSGDHLHPSEAGLRAMGDAVNLSFLK